MTEKGRLTSREFAIAGAFSGFITRFSCQPLDVVKILFQIEPKSNAKYTSIIQTLRTVAREEGLAALWKGHVPAQFLSIIFGAVQFTVYENLTKFGQRLEKRGTFVQTSAFHFGIGGAAGFAAVVFSFPFDTIRTRLVVQNRSQIYKGMTYTAQNIWIREGLRGFYRGLLPASIQTGSTSGLIFGFKNIYNQVWNACFCDISEKSVKMTKKSNIITGFLAGITSKIVLYPLDVVKKRLQIQGIEKGSIGLEMIPACKSLRECLIMILRFEGFFGLYKGLTPALLKAGVSTAIYFTAYHEMCNILSFLKR